MAFFSKMMSICKRIQWQRHKDRRDEIANHLHETERLLQVVNPNIEFDRETGFIGAPSNETKDEEEIATMGETDHAARMPPPVNASSPLAPPRTLSPAASFNAMPPPFQMPPPMEMPPPQIPTKRNASMSVPAAKKPRIVGPTMPPPPIICWWYCRDCRGRNGNAASTRTVSPPHCRIVLHRLEPYRYWRVHPPRPSSKQTHTHIVVVYYNETTNHHQRRNKTTTMALIRKRMYGRHQKTKMEVELPS